MAGISQQIPSYGVGGISEQPDQTKAIGTLKDVTNAIPDPVWGLYKRPGAKRIGDGRLSDPSSLNHKWFHYYRDEDEGAYIGHIDNTGFIKVWSCKDGSLKTMKYQDYNTDGSVSSTGTFDASKAWHTAISSESPSADSYASGNWDDFIGTNNWAYLSTTNPDNLKTLTINDTTFINNKAKPIRIGNDTGGQPSGMNHWAYIQIQRTENGRQYALNVSDNDTYGTAIHTCTKVRILSDNLAETQGTGHCPGIGTQVFGVSAAGSYPGNDDSEPFKRILYVKDKDGNTVTSGQNNLYFRLTITGQQGRSPAEGETSDATPDANEFECSYNRQITLLHGGEGWQTASEVKVQLTEKKGGRAENNGSGNPEEFGWPAQYVIRCEDSEVVTHKANIKAIRPKPTPFDSDTAVSVDSILGGIQAEFSGLAASGQAINTKIIGNGIFVYSAAPFNITSLDEDLMEIISSDGCGDVRKLPFQCKHGIKVKVLNSSDADEDDYWMQFWGKETTSNTYIDGPGTWKECAAESKSLRLHHKSLSRIGMPQVLQRQSDGNFLIKRYEWAKREVGDHLTNPPPVFTGTETNMWDHGWYNNSDVNVGRNYPTNTPKFINSCYFFRNRLVVFSGAHVVCSRPGTIGYPNFWNNTAMVVSNIDPVTIASLSSYPSDLVSAIETPSGLLCFSSNSQFLLSSDDNMFTPETAKLRNICNYNYNIRVPPVNLGTSIGFLDNSNKYSRLQELTAFSGNQKPEINDITALVPTLITKDHNLLSTAKENNLIFVGKGSVTYPSPLTSITGSKTVNVARTFKFQEQRQVSWVKWVFKNTLKYHFVVDNDFYFLDNDGFLQKINLIQDTEDLSVTQDDVEYPIHLDNWKEITGGTYDISTDETKFTITSIHHVTNHETDFCMIDTTGRAVFGDNVRFAGTSNQDCYVKGDWTSGTRRYGWLYEYKVDFPTIYQTQQAGGRGGVRADVNNSLTIHRVNLNLGKTGYYETTLTRLGKDDYTDTHESAILDSYELGDTPYVETQTKAIPVYDKNKNITLSLKSKHPAPSTLHSMSWEGDVTTRNYRRV